MLFSPTRFTGPVLCIKVRLKPGFAIDLCERKTSGPNAGECWDLNKDSDIKELRELIKFEEPYLLTGSPHCEAFFPVTQDLCTPA